MIFKGNYNRQVPVTGVESNSTFPQNTAAVGKKPIDVDKFYNISNPQNDPIAQPYAIPLVESISENEMFAPPSQSVRSRTISSADEELGAEYQSYGMANAPLDSQQTEMQRIENADVVDSVSSSAPKGFTGFIQTQLGRKVIADFLIGNEIISKAGYLLGAAEDYILINEDGTGDMIACDFKDIKFIKFV